MTNSPKRDLHVLMNGSCPGELWRRMVPESVRHHVDHALAIGATKHSKWSSAKAKAYYVAALHRHLDKWEAGELIDSDDGQRHLAAVIIRCAQLIDKDIRKEETHKPKG